MARSPAARSSPSPPPRPLSRPIDKKKPSVTLKNSDGKSLTVKVEDRKALENVVVGDEVVITYSEALALSVEKAKKKDK